MARVRSTRDFVNGISVGALFVLIMLVLFQIYFFGVANKSYSQNVLFIDIKESAGNCEEGEILSQKYCMCSNVNECTYLSYEECEENKECYNFEKTGSCDCPECEEVLTQCLPNE